jgi:hypothetical protein
MKLTSAFGIASDACSRPIHGPEVPAPFGVAEGTRARKKSERLVGILFNRGAC